MVDLEIRQTGIFMSGEAEKTVLAEQPTMKEKWLRSMWIALLFSGTALLVSLVLFTFNVSEFQFTFWILLPTLLTVSLLFAVGIFLAQVIFIKSRYFLAINYLFFCLGIIFYFQSNYFLWNTGPLLNGEFWWDWNQHGTVTLCEAGCYLVLIALLIGLRTYLKRYAVQVFFVVTILFIQFLGLLPQWIANQEIDISYKRYAIDYSKKFEFGKTNVILLVLDSYTDILLERVFQEKPKYRDIFQDFTRYTNVYCAVPLTRIGMCSTFSGVFYNQRGLSDSEVKHAYKKVQDTMFHQLKQQGFQNQIFITGSNSKSAIYFDREYLDNIVPVSRHTKPEFSLELDRFFYSFFMRISPLRLKGFIARNALKGRQYLSKQYFSPEDPGNGTLFSTIPEDIEFYQQMNQEFRLGTAEKVFKYYHLNGVHLPLRFNAELQESSLLGVDAYVAQGTGCLKLVEGFLAHLKKIGVYDTSLVVVMGDHGRYDGYFGLSKSQEFLRPLMLIKQPHEQHKKMISCDTALLQSDILSLPSFRDIQAPYAVLGSQFTEAQIAERKKIRSEKNNTNRTWELARLKFTENTANSLLPSKIKHYSWGVPYVQSSFFKTLFDVIDTFRSEKATLYLQGQGTEPHYTYEVVLNFSLGFDEAKERKEEKEDARKRRIVTTLELDCSEVSDGEYDFFIECETSQGKVLYQDPKYRLRMQQGVLSLVEVPQEEPQKME